MGKNLSLKFRELLTMRRDINEPTNPLGLAEFLAEKIRTGYFQNEKDRIQCLLEADRHLIETPDPVVEIPEEEKPFDLERFKIAATLWREQKEKSLASKMETA
jgi:hypothetical protein